MIPPIFSNMVRPRPIKDDGPPRRYTYMVLNYVCFVNIYKVFFGTKQDGLIVQKNGTAIGGAIYGSILVAGVGFEPTTFWL